MTGHVVTFDEAVVHLAAAEFTGWQIPMMAAIGCAESQLDPYAVNPIEDPQSPAYRTADFGWLQMNSYWWGHLADHNLNDFLRLAFDPLGCARMARKAFMSAFDAARKRDATWAAASIAGYSVWNVYDAGKHLQFIPLAVAAWRRSQ